MCDLEAVLRHALQHHVHARGGDELVGEMPQGALFDRAPIGCDRSGGAPRERPMQARAGEADAEDQQGARGDHEGQALGRDEVRAADAPFAGMRPEPHGGHGRVVHARGREAHGHAAERTLHGREPGRLGAVPEGQVQAEERGDERDGDREHHEHRVPDEVGRHAHGRHGDVVHAGDRRAHAHAAEHQIANRGARQADGAQRDERRGERHQERRDEQAHVVGHRHVVHAHGEHADEVHVPDADPQGEGAADQPDDPGAARTCARDHAGEIEACVRGDDRDDHGERDEQRIVRGGERRGHRLPARPRLQEGAAGRRFRVRRRICREHKQHRVAQAGRTRGAGRGQALGIARLPSLHNVH